ncbi:MAG: NmrA family NAD(P)-binding protein [Candidatus Nitrosopolaris sp.]
MTDSDERRILVTGATGNIGSELVKQLSIHEDRNVRVIAAVRSIDKAMKINEIGVEMAEIDYTKPTTLRKAFKGVDSLFLNTPYQPDMIELTSNMITEAKSGTKSYVTKHNPASNIRNPLDLFRYI